ncbi:cholesterol esterase [Gaertneriomyces sp. JEL0708]|nr:cholesterol esterase [Gaertneriomyces sp. JEL0708]
MFTYSGTDGFLFHTPAERRYWSRVGMDEIAKWDVPAVVKYVCERSRRKKCVYIGYSQGTAQMVMSASLSEEVQERVGLFIGLAPALCPKLKGLGHHLSPNHMRILGSGSFLPHAVMRAVIPHSVYAAMVHGALQFVTGWKCTSYPKEWHTALYTHLYGGGSVRNFIHWFQVATNESFAAHQHHDPYEFEECIQGKEGGTPALVVSALKTASTLFSAADELLLPIATNSTLPFVPRHTPPPSYPTHHLHMPTLLFAGSEDNLSDVRQLRKCFSTNVEVRVVDGYGHMDFLWAIDAEKKVWADIISAIAERM